MVALRFWRALLASVLYGTEARKAQKIIGDAVLSRVVLLTRFSRVDSLTPEDSISDMSVFFFDTGSR